MLHCTLSAASQRALTLDYEDELVHVHSDACSFRFDSKLHWKLARRDDTDIPVTLAQIWPTETVELLESPRPLGILWKHSQAALSFLESTEVSAEWASSLPSELLEADLNRGSGSLLDHLIGIVKPDDAPNVEKVRLALSLALLGWTTGAHCSSNELSCSICQARLPIQRSRELPPNPKRPRVSSSLHSMHRPYCPWVCSSNWSVGANSVKRQPFWRMLVSKLLDNNAPEVLDPVKAQETLRLARSPALRKRRREEGTEGILGTH